jgi:hypothetical protein
MFGRSRIAFSSSYFKAFKHDNHCFAFVLVEGTDVKKIIIDFTDSSLINQTALDWCDIYGKINLEASQMHLEKVVAIGPSFGIQIFGLYKTLWFACSNLIKAYHRIPNKRKFFSDYKAQWKRPQLTDYRYQVSSGSFVFFMASLWKQEPETNSYRAHFIKSCRDEQRLTFEGGFAPRTRNDIQGYEPLTTQQRIGITAYLNKTSKSLFVFNTPAVKSCHGWKLAEYLCLGKAIISTPLTRQLPSPLVDKQQLLYSQGDEQSLSKQIDLLITDASLRHNLETEARSYFETHLEPTQVIKRMVDSL